MVPRDSTAARKPWTQDECDYLRRVYADTDIRELMRVLCRSDRAIYHKAGELGLARSKAYLNSQTSGRFTGAEGINTQFKKGHATWNKGLKGYQPKGRNLETRFKPGGKPPTWKPVGSFRRVSGDVLQQKIADTGFYTDWQSVHSLIWKRHYGDIPSSHIVVFRDGDTNNIRLDNLELISRAENIRRNSIHNYPQQIKEVIKLNAKLKRLVSA